MVMQKGWHQPKWDEELVGVDQHQLMYIMEEDQSAGGQVVVLRISPYHPNPLMKTSHFYELLLKYWEKTDFSVEFII